MQCGKLMIMTKFPHGESSLLQLSYTDSHIVCQTWHSKQYCLRARQYSSNNKLENLLTQMLLFTVIYSLSDSFLERSKMDKSSTTGLPTPLQGGLTKNAAVQ